MTAQQSATEAQCPTAQQSVSSTAQQITTYTKLPNRVCPKAFVQHKSNFKSKSNTICPTLKSPPGGDWGQAKVDVLFSYSQKSKKS